MYSYMYSTHDFTGSLESLVFDTTTAKSLVPQFLNMKTNRPESILLNVLLKHKYNRNAPGNYALPSQIYMANTKNMPPDTVKLARQEWENMLNYEDEEV